MSDSLRVYCDDELVVYDAGFAEVIEEKARWLSWLDAQNMDGEYGLLAVF